ncbi:hypothetical protein FAZ95_13895 [Trinickia violacea]|uniref:Uncharacterized protein n=1 Tax=Trinickia violacea TaxID=2571746 RepID=A0A4P8IRZ1_9BURK|nr:hypothetical protein FAZ95_13895 [Trinickia violacea]
MLAVMRKGSEYTAEQLGRLLDAPLSSVRRVLGSDQALTRVDKRATERGQVYSLAGTARGFARHQDLRVRPDLTSTLTGYTATFESQRALAELTRR